MYKSQSNKTLALLNYFYFLFVDISPRNPSTLGSHQTIELLNQSHGNFTPARFSRSPTHCLRRFERSDCGYKGVSLCILRVVAHKLLHLFSGAVLVAHSQQGSHGAPAAWLGAKGTYLICPILRRRYLTSLSLSMSETRLKSRAAERGTLPGLSYSLNERTARIRRDLKRSRMSSSMPQ